MLSKYSGIDTYPVRGGCITDRDKSQLSFGDFSWAQNVRGDHPGIRKRYGQTELYTTNYSTYDVLNMYQFRAIRSGTQKLFVQFSDNKLMEQDNDKLFIPDQYTTNTPFESAVAHTGSAGQIPASFANVRDQMVYSNGADQHQIYCGPNSLVDQFIVFDGTAAPEDIPDIGRFYSDEVRDINSATRVAVLDSLNTYAAFECIFIKTKLPAASLTFDMVAPNGTASVLSAYYWNGSDWTAVSNISDGTSSGGATFAIDGEVTWDAIGDAEQEKYMYGTNGFWYQFRVSVQLDVEVEVGSVVFSDIGFSEVRNIWDGDEITVIEGQVKINADSTYQVYGGAAISVGDMLAADDIYIATADKAEALYIDPGATPNALATTLTISYWNGSAWVAHGAGVVTDGTGGLFRPGWITFPRNTTEQPREFNTSKYQAYWYKIESSAVTLSSDVILDISYMPYFDIKDFGFIGQTCCAWKDRAIYSFDQYGSYLYASKTNQPLMTNGSDFGILRAGDGRRNKVVAQRRFVNELMVWQEEIGNEGGCVTIFEGYNPSTFGRLVLSSKIGGMNAKSVAVVDGVMTSTETEKRLKTLAFFLSRYGVCVTDGRTISVISDDIGNYFDQQNTECIRSGYEQQMWLNHDSAENVIRIGLVIGTPRSTSVTTSTTADKLVDTEGAFTTDGTVVGDTVHNTTDDTSALITAIDSASTLSIDTDIMASGESYEILASEPNLFPVLDLVDKTWSFDVNGQVLTCLTEVSSDSGAIEQKPVIQLGGGLGDGTVYRLNDGLNDVSGGANTAIDSYLDMEVSADGEYFLLDEMAIRVKSQSAGNLTLSFYKNDVLAGTKDIDMTEEISGNNNRRHRFYLDVKGDTITIRMRNSTVSQSFSIHDLGIGIDKWQGM